MGQRRVVVLNVTQTLNMNGQTIDASGAGFRAVAASNSPTEEIGCIHGLYGPDYGKGQWRQRGEHCGHSRYINNNWASPALDNIVKAIRAAV